jgi:hypothetical protein
VGAGELAVVAGHTGIHRMDTMKRWARLGTAELRNRRIDYAIPRVMAA